METTMKILNIILTITVSTGALSILVKNFIEVRYKLKYDRITFYDTKYFNAYNDAWIALTNCCNYTIDAYFHKVDDISEGKIIQEKYHKYFYDFMSAYKNNALFIEEDIYKLFIECNDILTEMFIPFCNIVVQNEDDGKLRFAITNEMYDTYHKDIKILEEKMQIIKKRIKEELEKYEK